LDKYNKKVLKGDSHQIYLDSKRKWHQHILNWILNIRETVESLKKAEGHQIYLDSKGGTGFSFQTWVSDS